MKFKCSIFADLDLNAVCQYRFLTEKMEKLNHKKNSPMKKSNLYNLSVYNILKTKLVDVANLHFEG